MACELCGGGDLWIKACLTPSGSQVLVCDPCHVEHAAELTVVPGRLVATARCDACGIYGNLREFSGVRLGWRRGAYSGTCNGCVGKGSC
jgi:hypothetical protein